MKAKVTADTSNVWVNTPKMSEMLGMLIADNRLVGTSTLLTFKPCNCMVAVTTTAINAPGKRCDCDTHTQRERDKEDHDRRQYITPKQFLTEISADT